MLVAKPDGNYRSIAGSSDLPFCNGVVADSGYEIVRATLETPLPFQAGFDLIERHLTGLGRARQALCGVELRCAEPYTPEGFRAFNAEYAKLLRTWDLWDQTTGRGCTARTNIAPTLHPPGEQVLFAFAYTVPSESLRPTFVVSGATGGRVDGPDAVTHKVANIVRTLEERLEEMSMSWELTTEIVVYAPQDIERALQTALLPRIGKAASNGVRWYPGLAPVAGSEIELGAHGVRHELRVDWR